MSIGSLLALALWKARRDGRDDPPADTLVVRFRRLAVRYERRADIHMAFLKLGCALVCLNQIKRFC